MSSKSIRPPASKGPRFKTTRTSFEEGKRYIIRYWPRTFNGYGNDYKRTPWPKVEEVIVKDGVLQGWCGDYKTSTTHTVRFEDVINIFEYRLR